MAFVYTLSFLAWIRVTQEKVLLLAVAMWKALWRLVVFVIWAGVVLIARYRALAGVTPHLDRCLLRTVLDMAYVKMAHVFAISSGKARVARTNIAQTIVPAGGFVQTEHAHVILAGGGQTARP